MVALCNTAFPVAAYLSNAASKPGLSKPSKRIRCFALTCSKKYTASDSCESGARGAAAVCAIMERKARAEAAPTNEKEERKRCHD
jgi:hypothetical protein